MPIDLLSPATALDLGGYDVPAYVALSSLVPAGALVTDAGDVLVTDAGDVLVIDPEGAPPR